MCNVFDYLLQLHNANYFKKFILMKKSLIICLAALGLLLIGGGVFAAIYFGGDDKKQDTTESKTEALDETAVFYINLDQLVQKSNVHEILNDFNRSVLANAITQELGDRQWTEYTNEILANLNNSGIDTTIPIYGYLSFKGNGAYEPEVAFTIVAEIADAEMVDRFVEYISTLSGEYIPVYHDGDMRQINIEDSVFVGYNNERFVFVACNTDGTLNDYVTSAFERPRADLSAYAEYDIAASVMLKPFYDTIIAEVEYELDNMYTSMEECREMLNDDDIDYYDSMYIEDDIMWHQQQIESTETSLEVMKGYEDMIQDNSNMIVGLVFEDGEMALEYSINGVEAMYEIDKKVSNEHLAYIESNALAVLNVAVDGEIISEVLSKVLTPDLADEFDMERNEFNLYTGIACDAIKSINGDVMIAVNDLYGNYYGINSGDGMVAISVNDNYIISAVGQFANGYLTKTGNNQYSLYESGMAMNLGQDDQTLYLALNMDYEKCASSAKKAPWLNDVEDSYGYLVLNIDSMMQNNAIASLYRNAMHNLDYQEAALVDNLIDAISYAYVSAETPTSVRMAIVFDDQQTNSLAQIVNIVGSAVLAR